MRVVHDEIGAGDGIRIRSRRVPTPIVNHVRQRHERQSFPGHRGRARVRDGPRPPSGFERSRASGPHLWRARVEHASGESLVHRADPRLFGDGVVQHLGSHELSEQVRVPVERRVEAGAVGVGVGERVEVPTPRGIFGGGEPLVDEGEDEGRLVVGAVLGAELGENPVELRAVGLDGVRAEDEVPRDGDVGFALVEAADGGEDAHVAARARRVGLAEVDALELHLLVGVDPEPKSVADGAVRCGAGGGARGGTRKAPRRRRTRSRRDARRSARGRAAPSGARGTPRTSTWNPEGRDPRDRTVARGQRETRSSHPTWRQLLLTSPMRANAPSRCAPRIVRRDMQLRVQQHSR